jgi:hypothetical protein
LFRGAHAAGASDAQTLRAADVSMGEDPSMEVDEVQVNIDARRMPRPTRER